MGSNQNSSAMSDVPSSAFNADAKSGLLNALKNKLEGLSGRQLKKLLSLTPNAMECVDNLRKIQSQYDELEAKFFEEKAALDAKYKELYQPLFTKRYELINGESTVSDTQKEEAEKEDKGIPGFWLNALKNNDVVGDEIHESDEEVLKYLKDIKWSKTDEPKGFKLEFLFDTNPFFKNSVLTKSYHMIDEDDLILERAIGTEIEWYPGKCLTSKALGKKPKKMLKSVNPITKTEQCESFFHFFSPPDVPAEEVIIKEEAAEELQNVLELDYDIGSTIRDEIIPHAVLWFTGEAVENEYAYDDDDTSDDEDDEDDYDEFIGDTTDDEEDDDEEDGDKDDEDEDTGKAKMKMITPEGDGPQGEKPSEI